MILLVPKINYCPRILISEIEATIMMYSEIPKASYRPLPTNWNACEEALQDRST